MKFGLLPAAIAGALLSGNAFAGTEACIEISKTTASYTELAAADLYEGSACSYTGTSTDKDLLPNNSAKIAYELTKVADYDLEDITKTAYTGKASDDLSIVYVPTTDVPPAARLTFKLNNATFAVDENIIHLVKVEEDSQNPGSYIYTAVASSDGQVDGESTALFMVKSGVTVGAGTRLFLSTSNQPTALTGITTPGIHLEFTEECTVDQKVTLEVIDAKTDFGFVIAGAKTQAASDLVVAERQYQLAVEKNLPVGQLTLTVEADVNAEDPSQRKFFLTNTGAGELAPPAGGWDNQTTAKSVVWEAYFQNNFNSLDLAHVLRPEDKVLLDTNSPKYTGTAITLGALTQMTNATTALDKMTNSHLAANTNHVDFNETTEWATLNSSLTSYHFDAEEVFGPTDLTGADTDRALALVLATNGTTPMNFGYSVDAKFGMDLADVTGGLFTYHDTATSCNPTTPFAIDVNGAVLKVPYAYNTDKNWVRITNEHDTEAEVTVEVFDENDAAGDKRILTLAKIGADDSTVYKADAIIALYEAEIGRASSNRVSMTFTVTAPKDTVHGVSVQAIPGGVDRVLPVLDQNNWNQ